MPSGQVAAGGEPVVERERELGALDALLDAVRAGEGSTMVVEGVAGIGKTRLLEVAAERAAASGIRVLRARGSELEADFTFGVVRQALERTLHTADGDRRDHLLSGPAGLAAEVVLDRRPHDDGPTADSSGVLHGLYWLAVNLADEAPHLLVVDDLQASDDDSLRFLAFAAGRLSGLHLGLLAAVRTGEGSLAGPVLALEGQPDTETVRPTVLTVTGIAQFTRRLLGADADNAFAQACMDATGGIPFYVRELLAELARDGVAPTAANRGRVADIRPESVARSVVARIAQLPGHAIAVAHAVAVLGDTTAEAIVADVAGVSADATRRAIAGMRATGVLAADDLTFAHPIMGGAVYEDMGAAARADAHGRAAHVLASAGAPPERVSAHLLRAPKGTGAWGVDVLRAAAQTALDRGGADEAVTLLRRALTESADADHRLAFELGRAEWHAGSPDAVGHLELAYGHGAGAPWWPQAVLFLARALMVGGRLDDAARVVDDATARLAGTAPEVAARVAMEFFVAARQSREFHHLAMARLPELERVVGGFDTQWGRLVLGGMAMHEAMGNEPAARVAEHARRAWGGGDLLAVEPPASLHFWPMVHARICADDLDGAEDAIQRLLTESRRRGSATGLAMARLLRAVLTARRGSLFEAEADAVEAVALTRDHFAVGFPMAVGLAVETMVERGDAAGAGDVLAANEVPSQLAGPGFYDFYLCGRGQLRLARRDWSAGRDDLLAAGASLVPWGGVSPTLRPWRSRAAAALNGLGDRMEAARLAGEALVLAESFGSALCVGIALQALAGLATGDERRARLGDAVDALDGTPFDLESARARAALGTELRRRGEVRAAREHLRRGLDLAVRCGAGPIEERARHELVASGARPRRTAVTGVESLTATERRICTLAADGLTNRDIAQELFVTVKTVEVHLTNSYRKLAITSRHQLADAIVSA